MCGKFGEGTAESEPVPAPKSEGQRLLDLFIEFSGHVYTVTGERLGNFVR